MTLLQIKETPNDPLVAQVVRSNIDPFNRIVGIMLTRLRPCDLF